ncbi:MAG TPA: hypothetical protein VKD69_16545, partial [Vicinamibacterales bacterium]|nr:hypothetical protein [Vicinamibacterales bacterium]
MLALMACVAIRMATPALAAAQTDFAALRLKPGKIVRVTEEDGTRTKGLLTNLTPDTIGVGDRTFSATRVARIEREGDALWNGIAIGAA